MNFNYIVGLICISSLCLGFDSVDNVPLQFFVLIGGLANIAIGYHLKK